MALTITTSGKEIASEKYYITATTNDPSNVESVQMEVFVEGFVSAVHILENIKDVGSNDTFTFEVVGLLRDYMELFFKDIATGQTTTRNVLATFRFKEVIDNIVQAASWRAIVNMKNFSLDPFQAENLDLQDYNLGDVGDTTSKFLTSSPNVVKIADGKYFLLSALKASYSTLTPKQEWVIETTPLTGSPTLAYVDVNVTTRTPVLEGTGAKYDISTFMQKVEGVKQIRVWIRDKASPNQRRSEIKTFVATDFCRDGITLHWINEFGVQESFTFGGFQQRTLNVNNATFEKVNFGDEVYFSEQNYEYQAFTERMPMEAVRWLSKIIVNNKARIEIGGVKGDLYGYLYNWYVLATIVNATQTGWRVPTNADFNSLQTFLGGSTVAGGALKSLTGWDAPNTGATNSSGFTGLGNGLFRLNFNSKNQIGYFWSQTDSGSPAGFADYLSLSSGSAASLLSFNFKETGKSVRLVRDAVTGETNGMKISNAYTGNNGIKYDGIVIDNKVWINRNLVETKYNGGAKIPTVTDQPTWVTLLTGAKATYDNAQIVLPRPPKYFPIIIEDTSIDDNDDLNPITSLSIRFRMAKKQKGTR